MPRSAQTGRVRRWRYGSTVSELLEFCCPRCATPVNEEFYGPCRSCVAQLRSVGGVQVHVEDVTYTPRMNVTPNFVATKD